MNEILRLEGVSKRFGGIRAVSDVSFLSLIHISEPTRPFTLSRMPSSA